MAKAEEKVMKFVESELKSNPDIATSELFERAKQVEPAMRELSLRQFNARFPLQIKRRKTLADPQRRRARRAASSGGSRATASRNRDGVRDVFLRFASDLSSAEERSDLVRVISQVDDYVDDAIRAATGK